MHRLYSIVLLSLLPIFLQAQGIPYVIGGYQQGFVQLPDTEGILQRFNTTQNHTLAPINTLQGVRFGLGYMTDFVVLELSYSNINARTQSQNPSQIRENAEFVLNYSSFSAQFAYRIIPQKFLTAGFSANLGALRGRYAFGGDYIEGFQQYTPSVDVFVDYSLKIKFLLRRARRDGRYYLLRFRPYYQIQPIVDVTPLERSLNENPDAALRTYEDKLGHFGFQVGLSIPFFGKNPDFSETPRAQKRWDRYETKAEKANAKKYLRQRKKLLREVEARRRAERAKKQKSTPPRRRGRL